MLNRWRTIAVLVFAALVCGAGSGCVNHDQVFLVNPNPCHISCEYDCVAPLDPACSGYHATSWRPWCGQCPQPPAPLVGVTCDENGPGESPNMIPDDFSPELSPHPAPLAPMNEAPTLPVPPQRSPGAAQPNELPPPGPMPSSTIRRNSNMQLATGSTSHTLQPPPRATPPANFPAPRTKMSDDERRESFYRQMGYKQRRSASSSGATNADVMQLDNLKPTSDGDR